MRPEKFGALRNAWQQGAQKRLEEAIGASARRRWSCGLELTIQALSAAGDQLLAEDGPDTVAPSAIVARRGNGAAGAS